MNLKATRGCIHILLAALLAVVNASAAEPVFPVKVSPNGRNIVDQRGEPVFWLGTTQWQLFREYTLEEAELILDISKDKRKWVSPIIEESLNPSTTCLLFQSIPQLATPSADHPLE